MAQTETDAIAAYDVLRRGGLVLLPTDVGYGLVAMSEPAIERIYVLKGRPHVKPCVTVVDREIFDALVLPVEPAIRAWIDRVTGYTPLAVVTKLDPASPLVSTMTPFMRGQATQHDTIATFHNAGKCVQAIARLAYADGRVVVGSSANTSGTGNNCRFEDVPGHMKEAADLVLDRGPCWYANEDRLATTILELAGGTFLRRGVNFALIEQSWRWMREVSAAPAGRGAPSGSEFHHAAPPRTADRSLPARRA